MVQEEVSELTIIANPFRVIKFLHNLLKDCSLQELIENNECGILLERAQELLSTMESDGFNFDCHSTKVFLQVLSLESFSHLENAITNL